MSEVERTLVERATSGDAGAVDQLLARHLPALHAFVRLRAHGIVALRESSADLVQSVCREVLQDLDAFDYRDELHFKHWLFTSALRKIRDRGRYWRRQRRDAGRDLPQAPTDAADLLAQYATLHTPSQDVAAAEAAAQLERAFDALSEEQREVVTLSRIVGLSHREIAEQLGKSEGAVRVTLHRALARLAKRIET